MIEKTLRIPKTAHPLVWAVICIAVVLGIGLWGVYFNDIRINQITIDVFLNQNGSAGLNTAALAVEKYFSPIYAVGITGVLAILVWIATKRLSTAIGFGLVVAAAWLPVAIFKLLFDASRPDSSAMGNFLVPTQVDSSYPSGHVSFAIGLAYALYLVIGQGRIKTLIAVLGILLVAFVIYARLYVGVHYLSDTVGSVFASIAGILIFNLVWQRVVEPRRPKVGEAR